MTDQEKMTIDLCYAAQTIIDLLAEKDLVKPNTEVEINTIKWLKHKYLLTENEKLTNEVKKVAKGIVNKKGIFLYLKENV